jgi:hypothetical protein
MESSHRLAARGEHDRRPEPLVLGVQFAFQLQILRPSAYEIDQIKVLAAIRQVVHPLPSLPRMRRRVRVGASSVALLAVSQLCTMRSKSRGSSDGAGVSGTPAPRIAAAA